MSLSILGYVLEHPRVGGGNSSTTFTPDVVITDSVAYGTAFPSGSEPNPRVEYLTLVEQQGKLDVATFGWTKNEVVQRFDYDGKHQQFKLLPGSTLAAVGTLGSTSNTMRLSVVPPTEVRADAPFRLSIGSTGSGTTQTAILVTTFGSPPAGTTEILINAGSNSGQLNWNPADLVTFNNQQVRFQQQAFFTFSQSTGLIGTITTNGPTSIVPLLLNPLPGPGQYPQVRLGFGLHLTPLAVATEADFTPYPGPASGTFEWAEDTGRLNFNWTDTTDNTDSGVFFDGTLINSQVSLPVQTLGTVASPSPLSPVPVDGGDIIFRLDGLSPPVQFGTIIDATTTGFSSGSSGTVQVNFSTGQIQFAGSDQSAYGSQTVTAIICDLPLERGLALRLYRSQLDLTDSDPTVLDVTSIYEITTQAPATLASPIIASPQVFLPQIPIESTAYPVVVSVTQGTGTYTNSNFPNLDTVPPPSPGLGYSIDFSSQILQYGKRVSPTTIPISTPTGALYIGDPLVLSAGLSVETQTPPAAPVSLVEGVDFLIENNSGVITFTETQGEILAQGSSGVFQGSGTTFYDPTADFTADGVAVSNSLVVTSGQSKGVYTVLSVIDGQHLTTDLAGNLADDDLVYQINAGQEVLGDRFFSEVIIVDPNTTLERLLPLGTVTNSPRLQITPTYVLGTSINFASTVTVQYVLNDTLFTTPSLLAANVVQVSQATGHLNMKSATVTTWRFRYGDGDVTTFTATTNLVYADSAFTNPTSLPSGTVEVSFATGNLNFSAADVATAQPVFWSRYLKQKVDYTIQPVLGFVQFTDRMLANEEAQITYANTNTPTVYTTERVTFLVRKEVTFPFPRSQPVSTVFFNPLGRAVATTPAPAVFRGGRPQDDTQVTINTTNSSVTFLPSSQVNTALPAGAILGINERVYVDYYVYGAMGGERTFTVQNFPINLLQLNLAESATSFTAPGDQTSVFFPNSMFRVEASDEYHLIGSVSYDAPSNTTTVEFLGTQTVFDANGNITTLGAQPFQAAYNDPKVYVSSGLTRLTSSPQFPAYFVAEPSSVPRISRGANSFSLPGDRTSSYRAGTIILFTDGANDYYDFYAVTGATVDTTTDTTLVTIQAGTLREYAPGVAALSYSVRPIYEDSPTKFATIKIPVLMQPDGSAQPYLLYRRTDGMVGRVLQSPADYSIDNSGNVTLTMPLLQNEEVAIFYTGTTLLEPGTQVIVQYSATIVPTTANGLLNQNLQMAYYLYQPDTFYFRVETMSNFSGQILTEIEQSAQSASPTGGPMTSNSASTPLYSQGRNSIWYNEGHYLNADLVARAYLLYFNTVINHLEDVLQDFDGRVVGDSDGRFLFDGNTNNPVRVPAVPNGPPLGVTNQIDDKIEIGVGINFSGSWFPSITLSPIYQTIYQTGKFSRFFPTRFTSVFGALTAGKDTNAKTGDVIGDFGVTKLSSVPGTAFKRWPRAMILKAAKAGDTVLYVDNASGQANVQVNGTDFTPKYPILRPPFASGMKVLIEDTTGTYYVPPGSPGTVSGIESGPERIEISALPTDVPAGACVYLYAVSPNGVPPDSAPDTTYAVSYRVGFDLAVDANEGKYTYIKPFPPFDGSVTFPSPFDTPGIVLMNPPNSMTVLEMDNVGIQGTGTAPRKFPALYGAPVNDAGDQVIPMVNPSPVQEIANITQESSSLATLLANSTSLFTGTGNLNAGRTIITLTSGTFPAPVPQIYDYVRITTGLNAESNWYRISVVTTNSVTVDTAFPVTDTGFTFEVAVSSNVHTGTATWTPTTSTTVFVDATLPGTVLVGMTVIIMSGPAIGEHRQIQEVSGTTITLDSAVTSDTVCTYRVSNSVATFTLADVVTSLSTQLAVIETNVAGPGVIDSEMNGIANFFNAVGTDTITPVPANGTASASTLTAISGGVNFEALDNSGNPLITTASVVYIQSGTAAGVYPVATVTSATVLTTSVPFTTSGSVSFRVLNTTGVGSQALIDVFSIYLADVAYVSAITSFQSFAAQVAVTATPADASAYATGMTTAAATARQTAVSGRLAYLNNSGTGPTALISKVLSDSAKLYDTRYTWISARIDTQNGYVQKAASEASQRSSNLAASLNALTELNSLS